MHGGPARKKARIVICGNFQEVHPDEFTASKTPSYPAFKKALYGLRTSPIAWETERDNTLSLKWVQDEIENRLLPCQRSPCLWMVVPIRPGEDPSVKTSKEELTRRVVITYVDDLLLTGWQYHIDAITKALLAKYVMKMSGSLPDGKTEKGMSISDGIDILGARITRDDDGTVWCDQSKYILHCMRENHSINEDGQVVLKRASAPPEVDEKLGEEEGTVREKNDALTMCRKYIGQMMWLTTRAGPDIAACLGILASLMVRRPKEVKNHLVCFWRYLWTTKDHAMCTLPSPKAAQKIQKDECVEANPSGAQDGLWPSPLTVQTYCDASFAPGGGRSRSGILVLLVDQQSNRASFLLWQSRRQTLAALLAPEAEVVALSEALVPAAVVIHESCCDIGLEAGQPTSSLRC